MLPSISGLHFSNSFPSGTSYPVISLPVVGTVVSGDAGNGICGGFVFTALDMLTSEPKLEPPATTALPPDPSRLFNYISQRLVDSFGPSAYANASKAIQWIQTPSHDVAIELQGPGLGHREEWWLADFNGTSMSWDHGPRTLDTSIRRVKGGPCHL